MISHGTITNFRISDITHNVLIKLNVYDFWVNIWVTIVKLAWNCSRWINLHHPFPVMKHKLKECVQTLEKWCSHFSVFHKKFEIKFTTTYAYIYIHVKICNFYPET